MAEDAIKIRNSARQLLGVINVILEDFVRACDPLRVEIEGDFHIRGNIKTIVRASYNKKQNSES